MKLYQLFFVLVLVSVDTPPDTQGSNLSAAIGGGVVAAVVVLLTVILILVVVIALSRLVNFFNNNIKFVYFE